METETVEYVPFGEEWVKEMKKLPKDFLIDMFKKSQEEVSTLTEDNARLREAASKVIETANQYQFFLQGYSQGSASISEVNHAAKENDDAMNALQSLIHSDQPKTN